MAVGLVVSTLPLLDHRAVVIQMTGNQRRLAASSDMESYQIAAEREQAPISEPASQPRSPGRDHDSASLFVFLQAGSQLSAQLQSR